MPKVAPIQAAFNAGEFSPLLYGRVDVAKYGKALKTSINGLGLIQGGWTRRPGTVFTKETKDSLKTSRLMRFKYSTVQAYMLEWGDSYTRFFKDRGQIVAANITASITNGTFTSNISGWTDQSSGGTPAANIAYDATNKRMSLDASGGGTAHAEQQVTNALAASHSLKFRVLGEPGYSLKLRVGTTSTGSEIVSDLVFDVGYHVYTFTTTAADFYVQFLHGDARIVQLDDVSLIDNGPIEIDTPYSQTQVAGLKRVQSADVLYLAHPSHPPRKLLRLGHTSWSLVEIKFTDGPYLTANGTTTTLTSSATTGSATVTASSKTGINGGSGFLGTDVGRLVRSKTSGANWGWGIITAVASPTQCTVRWESAVGATTATDNWRLGRWSDTTGYPRAVGFYQDRLTWADGQTPSFSGTSAYEDHSPSDPDGTVTDAHGVTTTLNSENVQTIHWMLPDEKGMLFGAEDGLWVIGPSTNTTAFSPTNIKADPINSAPGSKDIQGLRAKEAALYFETGGRQLHEAAYVFQNDGFQAPDISLLAEHITRGGVADTTYQRTPHSIVWSVRADGVLLSATYDRGQDVIGWGRHPIGGVSDAAGTGAKVESIDVLPTPDGTRMELWLIVQRYVNGATKRYVEYMSPFWERGDDQKDAFFVDSGLTYNGAPTMTITGLPHLEGETVTILADGAAHPDKVVSSGAIALDRLASVVHVGEGYNSDGQTLRNNAGSADGTAQGKIQRKNRVVFRVHDTLGLQVGATFDKLFAPTIRTSADAMDTAVPLFSGDIEVPWEGGYSTEDLVCWRISQPFPATILAVMPQQVTQDR